MNTSISDVPTFMGQKADRGLIVVGDEFPDEGYATLKCGNTEVRISYTILHGLHIPFDPRSAHLRDMDKLRDAIHSITCEASLGRVG